MPSDSGFHTAEGSSRKRLKISREAGRPAGNPSKSPEVVSLLTSPAKTAATPVIPKIEQNGHANGAPCHHEQSLRSLNGDLDAMRHLITCKICDRFLYEPFSLTCGHTYCYSCLSSWMVDNRKKTCPDCRAIIKDQPAPSYVIREMVVLFTSKSELLPDGETSEEHVQLAKEESEIVTKDKANTDLRKGGLFKGHFKRGSARVPLYGIHDPSDNVYRCPQCVNEVEDGWCLHCHVRVSTGDDDSDDDTLSEDSLELDHELEAEDHEAFLDGDVSDYSGYEDYFGHGDHFHGHPVGGHVYDGPLPFDLYSEPESGDSDEENSDMDGFIDDDTAVLNRDESEEESEDTERETPARVQRVSTRRQPPIVLSSDEDEEDESVEDNQPAQPSRRRRLIAAFRRPVARRPAATSQTSESDDDESDEDPVPSNSQRSRRRVAARPRPTVNLDDSDDDSRGTEVVDTGDGASETSRSAHGGFSPLDLEDDGSGDDDVESVHGNGYHDYADHESPMSGRTENSMDEEEDGDMSDESENHNTPNNPRVPHRPQSHRLRTLGPHSARHADPATFPPPRTALHYHANHRPQLQQPYYQPSASFPTPAAMYMPPQAAPYQYMPGPPYHHPFNLGNVLNGIHQRNAPPYMQYQPPQRVLPNARRTGSNVSSQSSNGGGVDVGSVASGSSGSSHTVRADDSGSGRRRRRHREIEDDDEY